MSSDPNSPRPETVEMPRPTAAPLVLSLGLGLLAVGAVTSTIFLVVGGVMFAIGLGMWIGELLPHRGHFQESLVEPAARAVVLAGEHGGVEQLREGAPGYRIRMPEKVHPISAGVKGGIVGGIVMPLPALTYGLLSGHGLWYPVNLLAGMVLPSVGAMTAGELNEFHASLLVVGMVIHVAMSVVMGMIYGVLLPTLPHVPKPLSWGGLLMPLLWTGVSFPILGLVNPELKYEIDWPWFILSQFVFGVVSASVVLRLGDSHPVRAGLIGGMAGGLLMPVPAVLWSLSAGHGLWYPINLLAAMLSPEVARLPIADLEHFHANWLALGVVMHAVLSASFGLAYALVLPRLRPIPAPVVWGGLVLPLLWTASSYALMGVVNPVLQQRVDWPWFIASQFVFGMVAAVVVVRSEMIHIQPAGRGPDNLADFMEGS
jgi:uncharacterized membrane protein YagU involved in acid resistance